MRARLDVEYPLNRRYYPATSYPASGRSWIKGWNGNDSWFM